MRIAIRIFVLIYNLYHMKNVTVYSTPTCVYCKMVKDWLTEKGVRFTSVDLSTDIEKQQEIIEKTGQMAVPVIEIDDEFFIGFDRSKLAETLEIEE